MAKIRLGFVSNSSSSSFIIGIAKIDDGKVGKVQKIIGTDSWDFEIEQVDYDTELKVKSFMYHDVSLRLDKDVKIGDYILKVYNCEDEGDDYFMKGDGWECDYDIDYDDCSESVRNTIDKVSDYVGGWDLSYGAGRNG